MNDQIAWFAARVAALALLGLTSLAEGAGSSSRAPRPGEVFRDCGDCPEMIVLPAGRFLMGSTVKETTDEQAYPMVAAWEKPQVEVKVARPVAIGRFEVSRAEFARFVAETQHATSDTCYAYDPRTNKWSMTQGLDWRNPGFTQTDADPVVCVNVPDGQAYAAWLARKTGRPYRLISEAEWEYAARAGTTDVRPWPGGREATCRYANVSDNTRVRAHDKLKRDPTTAFDCDDGYVHTSPGNAFPPNPLGVSDLLGNTWSWTADCFNDSHGGRPVDARARTDGDCKNYMIKGGSWAANTADLRPAQRGRDPVGYRATYIGLRVALSLP